MARGPRTGHGGRGGRKLAVAGALAGTLALAMAACGSDDKPVTAANSGQPAATTPTTAAAAATTTAAPATVRTANNATFGTIMVDATGKTLYTFDKDTTATSACTGGCASTWPPLVLSGTTATPSAAAGVTGLSAAARPDDATKMQVVWNGKPLYFYAADTAPGDTKGDGVGGIWHVAKPA